MGAKMNTIEYLVQEAGSIESKIGYAFKNRDLLTLAFVHRSFVNENRRIQQHNERLEFLGDSILGLIISEYLYIHLPDVPEGELSYLRSRLVESASCVNYIKKLNVEGYILLGKGERMSEGRGRETILSDLFEAVIGAIYLDGGLEAAKHFVLSTFAEEIREILKTPLCNWKAQLQDYCQKKFQTPPSYIVISESGPDHNKIFKIKVAVNDLDLGLGEGISKKAAQQAAAENALKSLMQNP